MRLLHKGESLYCFRDSTSITYGGMLPSDLTISTLHFILFATVSDRLSGVLRSIHYGAFANLLGHERYARGF